MDHVEENPKLIRKYFNKYKIQFYNIECYRLDNQRDVPKVREIADNHLSVDIPMKNNIKSKG